MHCEKQCFIELIRVQQKYSRGWRGAPAKGVGRVTGARVQIPLSALNFLKKIFEKSLKKVLTKFERHDILSKLSRNKQKTTQTNMNIDN